MDRAKGIVKFCLMYALGLGAIAVIAWFIQWLLEPPGTRFADLYSLSDLATISVLIIGVSVAFGIWIALRFR